MPVRCCPPESRQPALLWQRSVPAACPRPPSLPGCSPQPAPGSVPAALRRRQRQPRLRRADGGTAAARRGPCRRPRRLRCPAQPRCWGLGWIWEADGVAEHPLPKQSGISPGSFTACQDCSGESAGLSVSTSSVCSPVLGYQLDEISITRNGNMAASSRLDGSSGTRTIQSCWHGLGAEDGCPEHRCQQLPQAGARLNPGPKLYPRAGSLGSGLRGSPKPELLWDRALQDQKMSPAPQSCAKAHPDICSFFPDGKPQALNYAVQQLAKPKPPPHDFRAAKGENQGPREVCFRLSSRW